MPRQYQLHVVRNAPPRHLEHKLSCELLGICRGILADGVVQAEEAEFLRQWMEAHVAEAREYPFPQILSRIRTIYADGVATPAECEELAAMLRAFIGEREEAIAAQTPSTDAPRPAEPLATRLFFDDPAPSVDFFDREFCPTGTFCFGSRAKVHAVLEKHGASIILHPKTTTHFVVVGTFAPEAWKHGNYGTKIEQAMRYRTNGHPVRIIAEEHWLSFLNPSLAALA